VKALTFKSTNGDNTEKNKNVRNTPEPRARAEKKALSLNNLKISNKISLKYL
jgi:peptidoglycan hydrolase-like amidase